MPDYVPPLVSFSRTAGFGLVTAELALVLEAYTVGSGLVSENDGAIHHGLAVRCAIVNAVCVAVLYTLELGYQLVCQYVWDF